MKEMKRNLLLAVAGITLIMIGACHNPFLPPKEDKGIKPIVLTDVINAAVPVINSQPQGATYTVGAAATALTVNASVGDGGTLSYQWYSNAENSNEKGTIISGETKSSYMPSTAAAFTNAVAAGYSGSGAITYFSDNAAVATVDNSGQVMIHKAGSAVISAEKAADAVYAHARADYTLAVNPKAVTIIGLSAEDKIYDGTTAATVSGTAVLNGVLGGDDVGVVAGTATFADATVGNGKTVIFSGWSLTGADAGNYILQEQPESVTADIELVSIIETVPIPAGTFIMGSPASEPNRDSSNETQHSVTLTKSFYMSTYQVTQAQYKAVMGAGEDRTTTTYGKGDNYPIYFVNWYDALVFCNKLSMMEGLNPVYSIGGSTDPAVWITNNGGSIPTSNNGTWNEAVMNTSKNGYRLPTEAEWEYACRGDYPNKATETNTKPFGIGDGTKMVNGMANFDGRIPYDLTRSGIYNDAGGTRLNKTTEVGSYTPNNYGLYDMHGNLREWCWDRYKADITADNEDPTGAVTGYIRVRRVGYWNDDGQDQRSARRAYTGPSYRVNSIGFRLVRF